MYYASLEEAYQNKGNFNLYPEDSIQQNTLEVPEVSNLIQAPDCSNFVAHYHNCNTCKYHFRLNNRNYNGNRLSTIIIIFLLLIIFFKF